jgi:hypothetical protein
VRERVRKIKGRFEKIEKEEKEEKERKNSFFSFSIMFPFVSFLFSTCLFLLLLIASFSKGDETYGCV